MHPNQFKMSNGSYARYIAKWNIFLFHTNEVAIEKMKACVYLWIKIYAMNWLDPNWAMQEGSSQLKDEIKSDKTFYSEIEKSIVCLCGLCFYAIDVFSLQIVLLRCSLLQILPLIVITEFVFLVSVLVRIVDFGGIFVNIANRLTVCKCTFRFSRIFVLFCFRFEWRILSCSCLF